MKILYFHQHFSTPNGATGTRSYEFSKALVSAGHEVTIICGSYWIADSGLTGKFNKGKRQGDVEGINVIEYDIPYSNSDSFLKRTWLFIEYAIAGIKIALTYEYDVLFATSTPLTAGIPGIFSKIFRKKIFIFEVRDLWPELPKAIGAIKNPIVLFLMDILETITYKLADRCVALAPGIAEGIHKKDPAKEVIIIPNGSDDVEPKIERLNKYGKIVAVFTGAHGVANGLDAVLDVAQELLEFGESKIEFQFIGDGKLKPALKNRAKEEGLNNCRFLDPMPKHELFQYLREEADIGLMVLDNVPAFYNGTSPNKFFDYISLGLPVINNYPGWLADLILKNDCGRVVNPGDTVSFAKALMELGNDPDLRSELGERGRILSEKVYSRNILSKKFVNYFSSV